MVEAKLGVTHQLPGHFLKYPLSINVYKRQSNQLNDDKIGLRYILSDASAGISGKPHDASPDRLNPPDSGSLSQEHQILEADHGRTPQLSHRLNKFNHNIRYPFHYCRHIRQGARCINPEKIPLEELNAYVCSDFGDSEPIKDEEGLPSLAFIFGEKEVMVAVSHSEPGFLLNLMILDDRLIATITTEDVDVLQDLENKCLQWELVNGRKIDVATVAQLMADILSSHCKGRKQLVALVAGFDYIKGSERIDNTKGPELYRVDHNGVLIKGKNKLAAGSGIDGAYPFLDPSHLTKRRMRDLAPGNICPHSNFPYEDKYEDMSVWSVDEAAWWA